MGTGGHLALRYPLRAVVSTAEVSRLAMRLLPGIGAPSVPFTFVSDHHSHSAE